MDFNTFESLAKTYNRIPVYEVITGDLLTPVSAFLSIRKKGSFSFLFESVESIGRLARYSFISKNPSKIFYNKNSSITIIENNSEVTLRKNIFDYLSEMIAASNSPTIEELPDFTGGIVGYLGYENISLIEDVLEFTGENEIDIPDSIFGIFNQLIAFDHYKHQIILIHNAEISANSNLEQLYLEAKAALKNLRLELFQPFAGPDNFIAESQVNHNDETHFFNLVEKCKQNILDGDVFQIVLSKRFSTHYSGDLINVYRALRIINPSPYMYFIELPNAHLLKNDLTIIGTSPEDLLKVKNRKATILPIAGTRRRGKNSDDDKKIEEEMLADAKEIAEHTMLVDLARNDLGRVCKAGTINLTESKSVHRFSHVMHIVSRVEGILNDDKTCIDALKGSFPAGTVTGAPKIRAIQLLNNYEKIKRGIYAGAVGYIDFKGNLDMCISIRTFFATKNKIYWQAGAGIVADSKPELELKEIKNKSAVLLNALKFGEEINESISYR